jgi:hypothetical protein
MNTRWRRSRLSFEFCGGITQSAVKEALIWGTGWINSWDLSDTLCGIKQRDGKIVVSGATGGVDHWSFYIAQLGRYSWFYYLVKSERDYLTNLVQKKLFYAAGFRKLLTNDQY